jgi:hypothetical protein
VNAAIDWAQANGQTLVLLLGGLAVFLLPLVYRDGGEGEHDDR